MRKIFTPSSLALVFLLAASLLSSLCAEEGSGYVGSEVCKDCHEERHESYARSVHAKKAIPGSPANHGGCESCHGPGSAHVDKGGGKGTMVTFDKTNAPETKSAKCLSCHEDTNKMAFWSTGRHKNEGLSCDSCHLVHGGAKPLRPSNATAYQLSQESDSLKSPLPDLCFGCHRDVRAQTMKQSHHPILEGKVKCTDCHTPHGGFGKKMVAADSLNDLCFKCHADKRGPFAFEHPPVVEDCSTCHTVHGSNHNKLLMSKPPQLCQTCHDTGGGHPTRPYNIQHGFAGNATANKNKFFARGCLNCHGNIHGSNRAQTFER
jgi:DmsE family decaheme c-type cytochrome